MDAFLTDALPSGSLAYLIYLAVFAVAAAGCLAGAWRARCQVSLPGVRLGLIGLLSASGLWALCHVGVLLSPGLGLKVAFYEAGLTVGFGTVFAWLWLCSSYSGRALHRRAGVRWAALILFLAVTLTKLTNRWHGLYFTAGWSAGPFPHLVVDHHVIYWLTAGLSYALAAVGFFMLAEPLRRAQVGGGKLAGLFALTALPLGANVIGYATPYLLGLSHEPVGVAAFALGALALRGNPSSGNPSGGSRRGSRGGSRLEETSRAGREERPSLVLSADGRVQNYNQAAAELFPALREGTPKEETSQEGTSQEEEIVGRHLKEALPRLGRALNGESPGTEPSGTELSGKNASGREPEESKEPEESRELEENKELRENGRRSEERFSAEKPSAEEKLLEVPAGRGEARYYRPVESQVGRGAGRLVVLQDVTERVLRRRERVSRLEAIFDSMPGLAFEFRAGPGGERSVEFIGEEAGSFLGLSSGLEEAFKRFTEHVPEGHRERFLQSVEEAVEGRSPWRHEFPFERPGGERIWLLGSAEPNTESSPEGEGVVFRGTLADITERKRREQELRESRRELRREKRRAESITENVSEGIYRSTEEEGIVYANSAFIEMFGYRDLQELREAGPEALYVDPGRREELIEKECRHGRLCQEEVRYRRKDGTVFVGLLSSQQVEGEEEGKRYFDGAITDITERKEEERRRKQTVQRVTDGIIEVGPEWQVTLVNEQAEDIYGIDEKEVVGRSLWDVFGGLEGTRFEEVYREVMRSRHPAEIEEYYSEFGEWIQEQVYPNENGGLAFYFRVITERKEREEALREAKRRYQTLIENFPDGGAFLFDEDLRYVLAGGERIGIVGGPEEVIGSTVREVLPEEIAERQARYFRRALEGKRCDFEEEYGGRRYRVQALPVWNEDGTVSSGIAFAQDITERRRRKEKLKQRKEELKRKKEELKQRKKELERKNDLFKRAQEIASVGAWEHDLRADEGNWTEKAYEILGHPLDADANPEDSLRHYHPEDQPRVREALMEAVENGKSSDLEVRVGSDGDEVRWVRIRGEPLQEKENPEGEVARIRGTIQDITERKEREGALRAAKEEAEEARREAEEAKEEAQEASRLKSALLANMSHEIRTPLTSIIGFAEMLGREAAGLELSEDSPLPGYASTIEQGGKRLLETLNGVLNLSKLQAGQMEMEAGPVDLPEQARLAAEELRPEAEEKGVGLELETGLADAEADEGGVQIVLRNLLSNAIKYTDEGGVTVRTYREDGDQEDVHPQEDSWAVLEVEDTGIGMDPSVAEGLFEPFRQASEGMSREYEGTGIGLAVTREAVAQMGGSIEVETQKGAGTCMTVRLPGVEGGIPTGD
ncbi:PAS domain S-box protein [Salinibacter ruber]|uniref:PAS domain S-box protein n=1 Tax=Salinibacter ruber TaxID=146919 RepID=UPI0021681D43|nr:PAS domain S-box protein [Salinibacter ruber]